jgi:hypothetical protein
MRWSRVRFTVRRLMAAVAVVALVFGGLLWASRPRHVRLETASPPRRSNPDHDIFDLVLADLIENQGFSTAVYGDGRAKTEIVLVGTTLEGPGERRATWGPCGAEPLGADVLDDWAERNPRGVRFVLSEYKPTGPRILVRDEGQVDFGLDFRDQFPKAREYVRAYLPAYSRDGHAALFRFSFGPTAHGARGCYLLRKVKGRWEIVDSSFGYFS